MAEEQFCVRWNEHQSTVISVFDKLLENETLVDCTLAAEGQYVKAHRVVLCACSPFLESLLSKHGDKHPILILKDVKLLELKSIIDYMYRGEVNISRDHLGSFLKAAESLQIQGLSDNAAGEDASDGPGCTQETFLTMSHPSEVHPNNVPRSSPHIYKDGSLSPSSRKRKRVGRTSNGQDAYVEDTNINDANSCDLPCETQTVLTSVPNILETSSITNDPNLKLKNVIIKSKKSENLNRLNPSSQKSLQAEFGPSTEKLELRAPLLVPKSEFLEEWDSEGSVKDLTVADYSDANDEMGEIDICNLLMPNIYIQEPSYDNGLSNTSHERVSPWQSDRNQYGMVSVAAEDTPNSQAASQGLPTGAKMFHCLSCGKGFRHKYNLTKHQVNECGNKALFACKLCDFTSNRMFSLRRHCLNEHKDNGINN